MDRQTGVNNRRGASILNNLFLVIALKEQCPIAFAILKQLIHLARLVRRLNKSIIMHSPQLHGKFIDKTKILKQNYSFGKKKIQLLHLKKITTEKYTRKRM